MGRSKKATEAELALWRACMRDATPYRAQTVPVVEAAPVAPAPAASAGPEPVSAVSRLRLTPPPPPAPPHHPKTKRLTPGGAHDLDGAGAERLRRGDWPIDARLDLHGLTQDQAHYALTHAIHVGQQQGKRCVLVITGKGSVGEGVLRSQVPRWINEPPNRGRVLAIAQAQPRHGGSGALYVLLKKQR